MRELESKIASYMRQAYSRVLTPEEDGTFSAEVSEWPGCFSYGDTVAEAYTNLEEAARNWLEAALKQGLAIPEPMRPQEASGRFALRMPKSLHARLTRIASKEGVSLNQFIVSVLAERSGAEQVAATVTREFAQVVQSFGRIVFNQRQAATTRMIPLDPRTTSGVFETSGTESVLPLN
jgi:antitoxin HicB